MKRVLTLAVAGMLMSAGSATAKTAVISLGSPFCVTANVTIKGQALTANESDGCQTFIGAGFVGKVKKIGTQAIIGGTSTQFPGDEMVISLDYPFVTGGNFTVYRTSDGVVLKTVGSGTYTVEAAAKH